MSRMIPGLDGLRAIAFLLVFALHTDYLQMGWVGVSLFFVLSGFLITGILLDMKQGLSAKDYFYKFYGRRFLRIFPLYYFYLILIVLLTTWLISIPYRPRYMQIVLDQVWYAVLYVYDFFFGTAGFQQSYFLGPVFRLAMFFVHSSGVFRFLADSPAVAIYPLPFSHMDAFAFGAYMSRFPIPRAKQQFFLLAGIIPALGFVSEYLATGTIGAFSAFGYPLLVPDAYKFIWAYSLLDYFFAVIIYGVAKESWLTGFLEWRSLRYLGKISYGLYVYHFPIVWFSGRIADLGVEPPLLKPLVMLIALSATILVASLSFHFLEQPIIHLKDRFFPLRSTDRPDHSAALEAEKSPLL